MKSISFAITGFSLILLFWGMVFLAIINERFPALVGVYRFMTPDTWCWSEIIDTLISGATLLIAVLALKSWKRKSSSEIKSVFIDSLTDSVHEYIEAVSAPIEKLRYIQLEIDGYAKNMGTNSDRTKAAIYFIQVKGVQSAKVLFEYLDKCSPALAKIRSLEAKGQVFGFHDYSICQIACRKLVYQHQLISGFCFMIGDPNFNWQNTDVLSALNNYISLDPSEISRCIEDENRELLAYFKFVHEQLYNH